MNFCTNCGADLKQTARFCLKCGKEVMDEHSEPAIPSSSLKNRITKLKLTMTRRQITFYSLLAGLGIVILIGHLTLSNMASPEKKIRVFEELLLQKDAEALYDMLVKDAHVQGTPQQLLNFLLSEDISSSIGDLIETADQVAKTKSDQHWGSQLFESGDVLSIQHSKFLFYHTIDISPFVVEMNIMLPANSTITVAEKEFSTDQEKEANIGTFIPGNYDMSYDAHFTFVPIRGKGALPVTSAGGEKQTVKLEDVVEGEAVKLESDYDGLLYINGKSTLRYLSEIGSLSPVSFNEKLKLKVVAMDANGNEMHSNELPLTSNKLVFEFPDQPKRKEKQWSIDSLKEQAADIFTQLQDDYQKVLRTIDFFVP